MAAVCQAVRCTREPTGCVIVDACPRSLMPSAEVRSGADHHDVARELVARMTLEEKLGCLDGDTPLWPGLFDMTSGGYYQHPWPAAKVPRLGSSRNRLRRRATRVRDR